MVNDGVRPAICLWPRFRYTEEVAQLRALSGRVSFPRIACSASCTIWFSTETELFEKLIGIDLGTVNVIVYVSGKGIFLQEPSVVAISARDNKIVAVGQEARDMLGRTPESIEVARPLRAGVVADYVVTEAMLRYFIRRAIGRNPLLRPRVMISTPRGSPAWRAAQ